VAFRSCSCSVGSSTAWPKADPFNLVNSGRLQQLAWLTLAFQMLALAAHARGGDFRILHINGVEGCSRRGEEFRSAVSCWRSCCSSSPACSASGTEMREELEGTV
jgi:hypothetical protein